MTDHKHIADKRKESLLQTIGNTFWLGLEDLAKTIGFGKNTNNQGATPDQISHSLDKFENRHITTSK